MASRELVKHVARTAAVAVTAVAASQYVEGQEEAARVASASAAVATSSSSSSSSSSTTTTTSCSSSSSLTSSFPWSQGGKGKEPVSEGKVRSEEKKGGDLEGKESANGAGESKPVVAPRKDLRTRISEATGRRLFDEGETVFRPSRGEIGLVMGELSRPITVPQVERPGSTPSTSDADASVIRPPPSPGSSSSGGTVDPALAAIAGALLEDDNVVRAVSANPHFADLLSRLDSLPGDIDLVTGTDTDANTDTEGDAGIDGDGLDESAMQRLSDGVTLVTAMASGGRCEGPGFDTRAGDADAGYPGDGIAPSDASIGSIPVGFGHGVGDVSLVDLVAAVTSAVTGFAGTLSGAVLSLWASLSRTGREASGRGGPTAGSGRTTGIAGARLVNPPSSSSSSSRAPSGTSSAANNIDPAAVLGFVVVVLLGVAVLRVRPEAIARFIRVMRTKF